MLIRNKAILGRFVWGKTDVSYPDVESINRMVKSHGKTAAVRNCSDTKVWVGEIIPGNTQSTSISELNDVTAVCVGQINNERELSRILETGNNPNNREVLLRAAYDRFGDKIFSKIDGAYGLAIWDSKKRKLLLGCDHKADTHLYYRADGNGIWFSTWLKIFTHKNAEIDQAAVCEFLRFFYLAPPRTIYKDIFRLEGGEYIICENGTIKVKSYLEDLSKTPSLPAENQERRILLNNLDEILLSSIKKRFQSHKVGVFLSGGIDSALIAAGCSKLFPENTTAYTVGFDDPILDESSYATAFAKHIKVPHRIINFNIADYHRAFEEMSRTYDQPFGDPACLPVLLTCQNAKGEVEVMTGGSGGDDLLGSCVERAVVASLLIDRFLHRKVRDLTGKAIKKIPIQKISRYGSLFDFGDAEELYIMWKGWTRKELKMLTGSPVDLSGSLLYRIFREYKGCSAQRIHDELHFLPPEDSRLESAGVCGLAYYIPYHDVDILNFAKRLPREERYTKQEAKVLLRSLYKRYFPEVVWNVRKHTFNIPLIQILDHGNNRLINEYLNKDQISNAGLVPSDSAAQWIKRYLEGDHSLLLKVWSLLVLHSWYFNR